MNTIQKIAVAGLTGIVSLTLATSPAMAAPKAENPDKGNSVSQSATTKEKGSNNKEAAHENAPGQVKKAPEEEGPTEPTDPTVPDAGDSEHDWYPTPVMDASSW